MKTRMKLHPDREPLALRFRVLIGAIVFLIVLIAGAEIARGAAIRFLVPHHP